MSTRSSGTPTHASASQSGTESADVARLPVMKAGTAECHGMHETGRHQASREQNPTPPGRATLIPAHVLHCACRDRLVPILGLFRTRIAPPRSDASESSYGPYQPDVTPLG